MLFNLDKTHRCYSHLCAMKFDKKEFCILVTKCLRFHLLKLASHNFFAFERGA